MILGRGAYLPPDVVTNDEVARRVAPERLRAFVRSNVWCVHQRDRWAATGDGGDSEELERRLYAAFIADRVGVSERHLVDVRMLRDLPAAAGAVLSSDLGAEAARRALADAGLGVGDVDLIICGSSSPDRIYPGTALRIQGLLRAERAFAYDVSAACSSFVVALDAARARLMAGLARRALVVGAEAFSHGVDWSDPASAGFFGDGAAAVVLGRADDVAARAGASVVADVALWSAHSENIRTGLGGAAPALERLRRNGHAVEPNPGDEGYPFFFQDGPAVFRDLVPVVADVARELLARNGLVPGALRALLLHQASGVMLDAVEKRLLGGPDSGVRVPRILRRYGNTSSAGVAIALAEEPELLLGESSCLVTFGGGYAVAAALLCSR